MGLGVRIIDTPVQRLEGDDQLERVAFADGSVELRRALFLRPAQVVASDLPQRIGCEQTEAGLIRVGSDHQTSVPGVYAAGDAATPVQQIVVAAASGAQAAITMNRDLVRADVGASDAMSTEFRCGPSATQGARRHPSDRRPRVPCVSRRPQGREGETSPTSRSRGVEACDDRLSFQRRTSTRALRAPLLATVLRRRIPDGGP
jgi:hypothetical protein